MKNRKLFAIITLVAFMLTMMPLMAFATSASSSSISVDDSTAKVFNTTDKDALEFILDLDDVPTAEQTIYVFAERNGSLSDADYITLNEASVSGTAGYLKLSKADVQKGENTLYVASKTAGTVTLKAYVVTGEDANDPVKVYNGSNSIIKTAFVGNGCTGTIKAADSKVEIAPTVKVKVGNNGKETATSAVEGVYGTAKADNGVSYFKVSALFTKGGSKLVDEKVIISVDKDGATVNKDEATTSATGKVDFKVTATKAGTYTVTIECAGKSEDYKFKFDENSTGRVVISNTVSDTIAVDNEEEAAVELTVHDANNNVLSGSILEKPASGVLARFTAKVEKAPADSSMEGDELDFKYDANKSANVYLNFTPDAAGEYTIKVYNNNTGAASRTTIKAAEFGTVDHIALSYAADTYALGATTTEPDVNVYDKNGVKKAATGSTKFSYSGLGVAKFASNGQITFKDDNDYAGKQIVVSVVNGKYSASTTVTIGAEAAALKFADATGSVGSDAKVNVQIVDVNGNATAIGENTDYTVEVQSAVVTERPEGANVTVDASAIKDAEATFLKEGKGTISVVSNKEGTVKANVVVKLTHKAAITKDGVAYTDENGNNPYVVYLSGVATVNFGAKPTPTEKKTVTFIIGNTTFVANGETKAADVAPYVANGRTFIPVRAFAEATGAKVEYDAATQVITITGEGLSAQMTIGSNILTVNGQTTVMDTAAAVTAEGRTVLPVRFAGQALGYGFEVAYGANGAVSSVTMFK